MFSIYRMSSVVDETFCSDERNKMDDRCSCYNVIDRDCEEEPDIPGCKESLKYVEGVLSNIPETDGPHKAVARVELMRRLYCPGKVCVGQDKYKPPIMDDLRKTSPCGLNLNMCVQNTEIDTAVDTEVTSKCEINENFMGTDPWELDFEDDESGDIERLKQEHKDKVALRKLELEESRKQRESSRQYTNLIIYSVVAIIAILIFYYRRK